MPLTQYVSASERNTIINQLLADDGITFDGDNRFQAIMFKHQVGGIINSIIDTVGFNEADYVGVVITTSSEHDWVIDSHALTGDIVDVISYIVENYTGYYSNIGLSIPDEIVPIIPPIGG